MKPKKCFKCEKGFVPENRTILLCDECRKTLELPSLDIQSRPPIKVPKVAPKKKDGDIDAWEKMEVDGIWLRFKYWNDLRLSIALTDIQNDPEWWAALRDIRLIIQRFRK